jgi:hypothetical protein
MLELEGCVGPPIASWMRTHTPCAALLCHCHSKMACVPLFPPPPLLLALVQVSYAEYTNEVDTRRHLGQADGNASIPKLPEGKKVGAGQTCVILPAASRAPAHLLPSL